ncbi:THO complex subunit [Achlya hypogyna]|uniref:THO complex subunit n=1 Tax=Achlya hypogyna TaxID=1202772 RepID=A0A1V9ZRK6_ACHHY|nr:THO complex subunit [Achlya hypogyna]
MRTACELATFAQGEIIYFFRMPEPLRRLGDLFERIKHETPDCTDDHVHTILELAIQRVAEKMSWDLHRMRGSTVDSVGISTLVDLCIAGAKARYLMINAPYKVLEDLMDCQTIVVCEQLWGVLESRRGPLTTSDFIQAGKNNKASLCLLRMCNALLRRLSKTHNTVFCGRILMFLAYTFSLSERSAVNLTGKFNLSNVTTFQTEAEFKQSMEQAPLEEAATTDFALYKVFWDIQRFLRNPNLATESDAEWSTLFHELDQVLTAFESNPFSPEDIDRARELQSQTSSKDDDDHFFQTKYLTNSRLFHLQLHDPVLRECMLTQFLILFGHLERSKIPATASKVAIDERQDRVLQLLRKNVNGTGFSTMLAEVLERERNFVQWKSDKCPVYEKQPVADAEADDTSEPPRKRLNTGRMPTILEGIFKEEDLLKSICGSQRATRVSVQTYIQRFEEAWDPENGIEKEYWPDKDKMHCWRTMRGCMRTNVIHLDKAVHGTPAIVRGVLGRPEETPIAEAAEVAEASPNVSPDADDDSAKASEDSAKPDDGTKEETAQMSPVPSTEEVTAGSEEGEV